MGEGTKEKKDLTEDEIQLRKFACIMFGAGMMGCGEDWARAGIPGGGLRIHDVFAKCVIEKVDAVLEYEEKTRLA